MQPDPAVDANAERFWDAFRYVSGDLTGAEVLAFEERLDVDQDAREALARAVELASACYLVDRDRPTIRTGPRPHPLSFRKAMGVAGLVSLAAAACLAVVLLRPARPERLNFASTPDPSPSSSSPSPIVTLAWSTLHQETRLDAEEESPTTVAESLDEIESETERGLPLWLLDAASLVRDRSDGRMIPQQAEPTREE